MAAFERARVSPLYHVLLKPLRFPQGNSAPGRPQSCAPAPGDLLPLSSHLPFLPQALSSHSRCFKSQLLCQEHVCLSLPSSPFTGQKSAPFKSWPRPPIPTLSSPPVHTQSQLPSHHQLGPCAFMRKMRRQHVEGRTGPQVTCLPCYALVESPWENLSTSQSLSSVSVKWAHQLV